MNFADVITLDWEGDPIQARPHYPPRPCGLAFKDGYNPGHYIAFGHPVGNNGTWADAYGVLQWAWKSERPILCHNMSFDMSMCVEGAKLPPIPWQRQHDSMFLLFLDDPNRQALDLKDAAEKLLSMPPEERDAISDWVWENRAVLRQAFPDLTIGRSRNARGVQVVSKVWQWISKAPGQIVAPYAIGDVERTFRLFEKLYPSILSRGMGTAYDRERRFLQMCMENERLGMRVDVPALSEDTRRFLTARDIAERALRGRLNAPSLNLDADIEVAEALTRAGIINDDAWTLTDNGQKSMSKKALRPHMFNDPQVAAVLGYRNRLQTSLSMFMEPWLEQALASGGTIHTHWNQTIGPGGGTRTGRPSTNAHNFLNISKDFETKKDGYVHPTAIDVPSLPLVRKYVVPDEGHVFLHRDFKGQELRVFAHYEQGPLHAAYCANPMLDPHDEWVRPMMEKAAGKAFDKTTIKVLNFQGIYGGGATALAEALEISHAEAKKLRLVHKEALPGLEGLNATIKTVFLRGDPIVTWGGRVNFCQAPGFSKKQGRWTSYEYRGTNTIVQGSAADITKDACVEWYENSERDARFLVQVYDEINVSAEVSKAAQQMQLLKHIMEKDRLSVPMRSDGKMGPSWGKLEKCL